MLAERRLTSSFFFDFSDSFSFRMDTIMGGQQAYILSTRKSFLLTTAKIIHLSDKYESRTFSEIS